MLVVAAAAAYFRQIGSAGEAGPDGMYLAKSQHND
jgi:hypothetical protein